MMGNVLASDRDLADFCPGVLEVQNSPPSPSGRLLLWVIVTLFAAAGAWAYFGRVDIVASARGQLVPTGQVKVVQAMSYGTVTALHAEDGQRVVEGELLVELDPTLTKADETRILRALDYARSEASRLREVFVRIAGDPKDMESFADLGDSSTQVLLLKGQVEEYVNRMRSLERAVSRQSHARAAVLENISRQEKIIPLVEERSHSLKTLVDRKLQGRAAWLEAEQERIEQTRMLAGERHRLSEIERETERLAAENRALAAEFKNNLLQRLAESEKTVQGLEQELVKAREQIEWQTIKSPATGTVQERTIHTVGGVVQPAQTLLTIVPSDVELKVDARLLNKDVGFVNTGQIAEIKIDTFPFTKFGTMDAVVERVSHDAVEDEWYGLTYETRLRLGERILEVEGAPAELRPGMGVTVEIKTGNRRVIEYLLDPLLRFRDESLRER